MSITATVEAGMIVLPPGTPWPSGTRVRIEAVAEGSVQVIPDPRYGGYWDNLSAEELARRQGVVPVKDPAALAWPYGPKDWDGFEESVVQNRKEQSR